MLPVPLNVTLMLTGYLLVMGYLALGLLLLRRQRPGPGKASGKRSGWAGLIRQVAGTFVGGYVLLMAVVVGYYHGVAGLGGRFLASAFTGSATMAGVALPVFLTASWLAERRRRGRRGSTEDGDGSGGGSGSSGGEER
ncbi:DUF6256 family protein [Streptomyces sp. TRM64462]|uniref:DUF6256 family protein n=1 Tax=Streptomyces sp. TRM64462 TaxID=2741726 RepID=UPI0015867EC2|nr:DUF6256 family protein [Streptomyces sp. TRM64462]